MRLCAGPHPLTVVRGPKGGTPQDYLGYALVSLDQHLVTAPSCFHASRVEASLVSVDFVHVLGAELTMDLQLNIGLVS